MAGSVTSRVALALELLSELKLDPSERIEVANALGVAAPAPSARAEATTERAKMTSILERQPLPVVIYEPPDFRIALANEAFRSLFGAEGSSAGRFARRTRTRARSSRCSTRCTEPASRAPDASTS
jgi:hypothetical protein